MIENSPKSKAETIEKLLLEGNVDAADEQFRSDYLDAVKHNSIESIETEKRELMKDLAAYKLLMLEISKDFVAKNSSNEERALERSNRAVRTGVLHQGDAIPISGSEVQALLKR